MADLTLLEKRQVLGNNQLDILKKYDARSAITDFAILLGGYISSGYYTSEGATLKNRTGCWWTKTHCDDKAYFINTDGKRYWIDVRIRNGGVRPALSYSSIRSISSNGVGDNSEIKEVEYGEYPQWVVDEKSSYELESIYCSRKLRITGKNYTTDCIRYQYMSTSFNAKMHEEYEYNGCKYIRFVGDSNGAGEKLSDGRTIERGEPYWIRVEPIIWLVDEKTNIALSKYILVSGVQFKNSGDYNGNFNETDIKQFMDNYLSKEIECANTNTFEEQFSDIDSIFEEAIFRMNEITEDKSKIKVLK